MPVDMLGIGPADAPAEYLFGLGELEADLANDLDGPAPSDCCGTGAFAFESRRIKPGGAGAAREGSICELPSKPEGEAIGGERKEVGAWTPADCGTRGDELAETMPRDMSVPGE